VVPTILEHGRASDAAWQKLDDELGSVEAAYDLRRVFVAERVYSLEVTRNVIAGVREFEPSTGTLMPETLRLPRLPGRLLIANTLPLHANYIEAAEAPWYERADATAAILAQPRSRWTSFSSLLAPSFHRATVSAGRSLGILRSARLAARIERYRLATGGLPDSLDQLARFGEIPLDPFTGKPLVYVKTADGYAVYTLGEERRDAGPERLAEERGPNWGLRVRLPTTASATQP
jgi:hypothetical protein